MPLGLDGSRAGSEDATAAARWLVVGAIVCLVGCSNDALTELVVAVHSDLAVPSELASVHLRVAGPSGEEALDRSVDLTAPDAPGFPLTLSLTPGSDALAPVVIEVTGTGPAGSVGRRVETGFVEGERRAVPLPLLRACLDVTCVEGETCTGSGTCVDAAVDPEALPPWTGEPEPFDAGGDAHVPTDAGADVGRDAHVGADAAADGDAECGDDTDCPDELMGACVDGCEGCNVEPVEDCVSSCERPVTRHSCVEGTCVPIDSTEQRECTCPTTTECEPEDPCMENATCSAAGACFGTLKECPPPCFCDSDTGHCMDDDGMTLCEVH